MRAFLLATDTEYSVLSRVAQPRRDLRSWDLWDACSQAWLWDMRSTGIDTVANVGRVHVGVNIVGDGVMDSLLSEGVMIVVKVFYFVDLSLVVGAVGGGGGQGLFLFRLTNSPLFSFLDEPVLIVIFYFALFSLSRMFSFLVVGLSCRSWPGADGRSNRVSLGLAWA